MKQHLSGLLLAPAVDVRIRSPTHAIAGLLLWAAILSSIAIVNSACTREISRGAAQRADGASPAQDKLIPLHGPSDGAMESRLRRIYSQLGGMESIRVEVHGGVVQLTGHARDLGAAEKAAGIARRLEGVVFVKSAIAQDSTLSTRLTPAWADAKREIRTVLSYLPLIGIAVAAFLGFAWLSGWITRRQWLRHFDMSDLTASVMHMIMRIVIIIIGLVVALKILGVMGIVATVIGALGLAGVAFGLIFRDWASNFIPGLMLGWRPPFESGDLVEIGDDEGRVVRITARDTVLITTDGEQLRIPNSQVVKSRVLNSSRHARRRLRIPLVLDLGSDLDLTADLGVEALRGQRGALEQPAPFMRTIEILADRIEVEFYVWIDQDVVNFRNAESRAKQALRKALGDGGIRFPTFMVGIASIDSLPQPRRAREPLGREPIDSGDGLDEQFLKRQVREDQESSAERDLLSEGKHGRHVPTSASQQSGSA